MSETLVSAMNRLRESVPHASEKPIPAEALADEPVVPGGDFSLKSEINNEEEEFDLMNKNDRDLYYAELTDQLHRLKLLTKKYFRKRSNQIEDPNWDNETFNKHGLLAAEQARLLFVRLTSYFNTLETDIQLSQNTGELKIPLNLSKVSQNLNKINETYDLIQEQIEIVGNCVDEALLVQEPQDQEIMERYSVKDNIVRIQDFIDKAVSFREKATSVQEQLSFATKEKELRGLLKLIQERKDQDVNVRAKMLADTEKKIEQVFLEINALGGTVPVSETPPQPSKYILSPDERVLLPDEKLAYVIQKAEVVFQDVNQAPSGFPEDEHKTIDGMFDNLWRLNGNYKKTEDEVEKSELLGVIEKVVESITNHVTDLRNKYPEVTISKNLDSAEKALAPHRENILETFSAARKAYQLSLIQAIQIKQEALNNALFRESSSYPGKLEYAMNEYDRTSRNYYGTKNRLQKSVDERFVSSDETITGLENEFFNPTKKRHFLQNRYLKTLALALGLSVVPTALGDGTAAEAPARATTIDGFDTIPGQPGHFRITNIPKSQIAPARVLQPEVMSVPRSEKPLEVDTDPMMPSDPLTPQFNTTQTEVRAAETNESVITVPTLNYPIESSVIPAFDSSWQTVFAQGSTVEQSTQSSVASELPPPEIDSETTFNKGESLWTITMGETRVGMLRALIDATPNERIAVWEHVREQINRDENLRTTLGFTTDANMLVNQVPLDTLNALFAETLIHVRLENTPVSVVPDTIIPATEASSIGMAGESGSAVSEVDTPSVESGFNSGTPLTAADTEKFIANYPEGKDGFDDRLSDWVKKKLGVHAVEKHRFLSWLSAEQFQDPYQVLQSLSVGEVLSIANMNTSAREAKLASMHVTSAGFEAVVNLLKNAELNPTLATHPDDTVKERLSQILVQDIT